MQGGELVLADCLSGNPMYLISLGLADPNPSFNKMSSASLVSSKSHRINVYAILVSGY